MSQVPGPEPSRARTLVVATRLALLVAAAGGVAAGMTLGRSRDRADAASATRYTCPMHPEVVTAAPARCPICGMALEASSPGAAAAAMAREPDSVGAAAHLPPEERRTRTVEPVRRRSLLLEAREMRGPAWVAEDGEIDALFYLDQIGAMSADESGTFTPAATPDAGLAVQRLAESARAWDGSLWRIRFRVVPPGVGAGARAAAKAGLTGWIVLARRTRDVVAVPDSAVIQSSSGPYVLVIGREGRAEKRSIELGEIFEGLGFAVVDSGVRPQEFVVSKGAFFVDADRRLSEAAKEAR